MALKLISFIVFLAAIGVINTFRSDYTFIETTKSFYKYHYEYATWIAAIANCTSDGASLYYPENETELEHVLRALPVKNTRTWPWIWVGISDLREPLVYETVDGRPLSEVYNKWDPTEAELGPDETSHCLGLYVNERTLLVTECNKTLRPYICKHKQDAADVVMTTTEAPEVMTSTTATAPEINIREQLEEVNTTYANTSEKQAALSERQAAAMQRYAEAMQRQTVASEKQMIALERQAGAIQRQTTASDKKLAALQRQAESMQRQAIALEKLVDAFPAYTAAVNSLAAPNITVIEVQENEDQIDVRSKQ